VPLLHLLFLSLLQLVVGPRGAAEAALQMLHQFVLLLLLLLVLLLLPL